MSDWTPEDVDALFQEGSEGYEFEYNETAWGQMENLLERRDRRRRLVWWMVGATLSLLLLLSAYAIWSDTNSRQNISTTETLESNSINKLAPFDEEIRAVKKEITPKPESQTTNSSKDPKLIPIAKTQGPLTKESSLSSKKSNIHVKTIEKKNVTANELAKDKREKAFSATSANVPLKTMDKGIEQKTAIITNDLKVLELSTNTESLKTTTQTALTTDLATLPSLSMKIDYTTTPIDFTQSLLENLDKVQRETAETTQPNPNHFVVGLLLSKEFSFVDMSNMTNLKWKAGLSVEYRFGGKYALKLGANYSQKDYMTSTIENYQVEDGFWPKATAPNTASGICDVLEVSISESYFMNGHAKKGFFVNAGLTSYFLLREQYNYTYDTNDPELLWSWGENNTNRHWFGIGEVSVGYNLPFADNSSLQIAPYAQIPLTGVGHGALKIFSSGVLIRYNFHLK